MMGQVWARCHLETLVTDELASNSEYNNRSRLCNRSVGLCGGIGGNRALSLGDIRALDTDWARRCGASAPIGPVASVRITKSERNWTMQEGHITSALGMTEDQLYQYLDELLREEAAEAAAQTGKSVDEELESPGFQAVGAAATYAIKLIDANNAFITRHLLDAGLLSSDEEG